MSGKKFAKINSRENFFPQGKLDLTFERHTQVQDMYANFQLSKLIIVGRDRFFYENQVQQYFGRFEKIDNFRWSKNPENSNFLQKKDISPPYLSLKPKLTLWTIRFLNNFLFKCKNLTLFYQGGGQFCPTSKIYSNNFNLGKVTQKCYQICTRNLFSYLFYTKPKPARHVASL